VRDSCTSFDEFRVEYGVPEEVRPVWGDERRIGRPEEVEGQGGRRVEGLNGMFYY
jgi:hypothetical protein